jgi:hypothetical protein
MFETILLIIINEVFEAPQRPAMYNSNNRS